ncbi:CHAD domain-containing protein [Flavobacterium sp. CG_23.5]|uniref:CHAD domain-containing protein n=1 Tax=Flavobacterium sp. CG_23.5 TaxID=2760708 RepID=UPI001AE6BF75|nr:CHAD domain-containing protein [Flavobacterium sp. CG_23.5]MBP2283003.1 CHAD domain-containing protein [Flavobacterium sp. CG_23.5]
MKTLKKYFKKRTSVINFLLEQKQQSYSPDTFHKLRVEIKRLKALFDLLDYCTKKFKRNKIFKPFKLIFKQGGKVRELQIEESLIKEHSTTHLPVEYSTHLKKNQIKEQTHFFSILNKAFTKKLNNKYRKILPFLSKINKKKLNNYRYKKRTKIEKLLSQNNLEIKKIHKLRKRLKAYLYNQQSLNSDKQIKLIRKNNILPELLGEWHDYTVITEHLKKTIASDVISSKEINKLDNIILVFTSKSELLFTKINTALPYPDFFKNLKTK